MKTEITIEVVKEICVCKCCDYKKDDDDDCIQIRMAMKKVGLPDCYDGYIYKIKDKNNE